jgi:hypothetical protein
MTPREVLAQIVIDCNDDVKAMDGKPLTGANVAQWFAETLAMIQALTKLVDKLYELELETHGHSYAACYGSGGEWDTTTGPIEAKQIT